jgi:hypothetical protein
VEPGPNGRGGLASASAHGTRQKKELKKVALDLFAIGRSGPFAEYRCEGGVSVIVTGAVLVPVVVDQMLVTPTLNFKQLNGSQKPEHLEGQPNEVLNASFNGEVSEQIGLAASLTQINEKAVEINAFV